MDGINTHWIRPGRAAWRYLDGGERNFEGMKEFCRLAGELGFASDHASQHLSCYDGLVTVEGKDIKAQVLAWNEQDVMAVEIDDQRDQPAPIGVNLRMLRPAVVKTGSHTATSRIITDPGICRG